MGKPVDGHKVKLIVGLLSSNMDALKNTQDKLITSYGPIDFKSDAYSFTQSDYYFKEMGADLKRIFLSFQKLLNLKDIHRVKLNTNSIENEFLKNGKRIVNIDPGYLDLAKLVLLSTKDYTHRIYLDNGIYAEVTLFYKDKRFNAWPWTYPDYKSEEYLKVFNLVRDIYNRGRLLC